MTRKLFRPAAPVFCLILAAQPSFPQRAGADWMTAGFDAQRSGWVRNDAKISVANLSKPGFDLVWKLRLNDKPRQLNSLTPPALFDFYISYRGFRTLGFFGTANNRVVGVDTDLGRIEWEKQLDTIPTAAGTSACPGGMTAAVTRPAALALPPVPTGGRGGRGPSMPKASVSEPYKGAVTIKPLPTAPPPPPPAAAKNAPRTFSPFEPHVEWALSITSDGKLHSQYVSNGHEPEPAVPFLPAGAHAVGLIASGDVAYTATTNKCGGAENGIWAIDLKTKKVTSWKTSGNIGGASGPAIAPDGVIYVAAGGELVALAPGALEVKAIYKSDAVEFASSPLIFQHQDRTLIAVKTAHGRIQVFDAALKAPLTTSEETPGDSPALASWQDPSGARWILSPAANAVVAWKLGGGGAALTLDRAWTSRDLVSPLPPIVVNGVAFALSSGEHRPADPKTATAERVRRSVPAVLYALDAQTGKELWNSGKTITSFVHSGGLAAGGTRVYVGAYDGTQYAFGFPIEH